MSLCHGLKNSWSTVISKMRIIFLTSKLNFTTAGGSILDIDLKVRALQELGNDVKMITLYSKNNDITHNVPYEVIEEHTGSHKLIDIQRNVYNILKKYSDQADIFSIDGHLMLYGAGAYRMIGGKVPVAAFFNRELMSWPFNKSTFFKNKKDSFSVELKRKFRFMVEKIVGMKLANNIDFFYFTNPNLQKMYEDFGLERRDNTVIQGDLMDYSAMMKEFDITKDDYLKRNKKQGPLTIFYSARMVPGKGFDLLLQAFARVKNKDNFHLNLGGDGHERPQVEQMIKDLKLEKYITLLSWTKKDEVIEQYKKADVFIQPKWRQELTSVTLVEAMMFGLPCIIPGGGGLAWNAGKAGFYFDFDNPESLAQAIDKIGEDYNLRAEMSKKNFERLEEDEMNYKVKAKELEEAMRKIVKK